MIGLHLFDARAVDPPVWLDAAEQARADAFVDAGARREFVVARGLLKQILRMHGVAEPRLVVDPHGKPRLDGAGPCFSLAHAGGGVAVAVAPHDVGVDLEPVRAVSEALREAALAPGEPASGDEAFFRVWTAKEAYMKRAGLGLAIAPRRLRVDLARAQLTDEADGSVHRFEQTRWGAFVVSWL